ncbi:MAG: T9SS type A sorting domain-containing protein [Flavobacteriaceae bacterium]|jgi:Leucine-rich repeat (LRR) protein|nr:T9SS type A sorting domain-containing protein [Flavobacteriaceae bacterium]
MRNLLFTSILIFVFFHIGNAQTINIPDANFKAKLLEADATYFTAKNALGQDIEIDTNDDGEIQVSEALTVYQLDVYASNIGNLTGIEAFTNLTYLRCANNNLTELDVSNNSNLVYLDCDENSLTELNVSGLTNLIDLRFQYNNFTQIDLSTNINLKDLRFQHNNFTQIDLSANVNLIFLICNDNSLVNLDVSNNTNLTLLWCNSNSLTELDVSNNSNIAQLNCSQNSLTELNVSNNSNLFRLYCQSNNLTELNVSNNPLYELDCANNLLTELDVSNNVYLDYLDCSQNSLTELNLSNNSNLSRLHCQSNNLTELDMSNNPLHYFVAGDNPNLAYINVKNGGILTPESSWGFWVEMWENLPNNVRICADDSEINIIEQYLNLSGSEGQIISSYCTFYPLENHNTITGNVRYDFNNDGCDMNDESSPHIKINITDGTESGATFTVPNGNYIFFTQSGNYTVTPQIENPAYFNINPSSVVVDFPDLNNNEETVNFCITPNGVSPDVEVVLAPIVPARPGFDATYKIVYRNKGNQTVSGNINFEFDDARLDFVSSNPVFNNQSVGLLTYHFTDLNPFETKTIEITLNVNSPMETPAVNIDDILPFSAEITINQTDVIPDDNIYEFNQVVVGAFDPNDITCIEGDIVNPDYIGEELHYVIRFENTGNYHAENIVVAMEIDTEKYDVDSLQLLNTSHNANAQIRNNVLEIFFNQIMLDSGGHGNILLVMKSVSSLSEGDSVLSKADIYFDYNYPIITNDAVTVFEAELSVNNPVLNSLISIYPNPVKDLINLTSEVNIKSYELFDISGRLIITGIINNLEATINLSLQSSGTYFIRINTDNGSIIKKILKD